MFWKFLIEKTRKLFEREFTLSNKIKDLNPGKNPPPERRN